MKARWDSWKLVGKIKEWFGSLRVRERVQALGERFREWFASRVRARATVKRIRKWFSRPLVPEKAQAAAGRVGATLLGAGVISIFVDAMLRPAGLVPIVFGALLLHYNITSPIEKD